jgi:multicomponent K+:H+ antiporter subunit E
MKPHGLRKLLPSPWLSIGLWLCWLMLNQSASVGQMLLGAALALAVPWATQHFSVTPLRPHAWAVILRLALRVLKDIVLSNIDVARRVLGPESALQPAWVWVPIRLQSPAGIVALAGIVTLTPGTVSSEVTEDRRYLLVHALHCTDPAALVADILARYEAPLLEILG